MLLYLRSYSHRILLVLHPYLDVIIHRQLSSLLTVKNAEHPVHNIKELARSSYKVVVLRMRLLRQVCMKPTEWSGTEFKKQELLFKALRKVFSGCEKDRAWCSLMTARLSGIMQTSRRAIWRQVNTKNSWSSLLWNLIFLIQVHELQRSIIWLTHMIII